MSFEALEQSRYSGAPVQLFLIQGAPNSETGGSLGPYAFNNSEQDIVREGILYRAWPIKHGSISHDGSLDKSDVTVTMALGTEMDDLFLAYPPMQVVNLTIFEGHMVDAPTKENFPAIWLGRITGPSYENNELALSCNPVSTSIQRPGLRRPYSTGCPHVLYGPQCRANKAAATVPCWVSVVDRNRITLSGDMIPVAQLFVGGLIEWSNADNNLKEVRTVTGVDGFTVIIRGNTRGLVANQQAWLVRGCNRRMDGCRSHNNILNYGGQPWIPLENPLSQKNQFY